VLGELVRPGKRRENGEKEWGVLAKVTVLNRHTEVGTSIGVVPCGRRGLRERESGSPDRQRPETGGRGRRGATMSCGRSNRGGERRVTGGPWL
jgi:hypothetical protein